MPPTSGDVRGACSGVIMPLLARRRGQLGGRVLDGLDDIHVSGAAAEVSGDRVADLVLARARMILEVRVARHEHARRAITALEPVLLHEALLHRMELAVLLETLDGQDRPP